MRFSSVVTDSRQPSPGALFVAIAGERFDGHDFVTAARDAGAVAALVAAGKGIVSVPRVEVADPGIALRDLAVYRRSGLEIPVLAVTGSSGKTSTKDLLSHILPGSWVSPASYNNEVGVPLTVLAAPEDARFLVTEVGSRGKGHISWLVPAVRPHVAIITNLGLVHMETFGSPELLAAAKWELVEGLEPGGTAVVPIGEPLLTRPHPGATVTFGPDDFGRRVVRRCCARSLGPAYVHPRLRRGDPPRDDEGRGPASAVERGCGRRGGDGSWCAPRRGRGRFGGRRRLARPDGNPSRNSECRQ